MPSVNSALDCRASPFTKISGNLDGILASCKLSKQPFAEEVFERFAHSPGLKPGTE